MDNQHRVRHRDQGPPAEFRTVDVLHQECSAPAKPVGQGGPLLSFKILV